MSTDTNAALLSDLSVLHADMAYRLGAMLEAAKLLADHQRVYAAVSDAARALPEFERTLSNYCTSWRNPSDGEADEVLHDLLTVACWELGDLVGRVGNLEERLAPPDVDLQRRDRVIAPAVTSPPVCGDLAGALAQGAQQ